MIGSFVLYQTENSSKLHDRRLWCVWSPDFLPRALYTNMHFKYRAEVNGQVASKLPKIIHPTHRLGSIILTFGLVWLLAVGQSNTMENGTFTSIVSTCSDLRCHQLASATTTQRLFESSEKAEPPDPLRSHPERAGGDLLTCSVVRAVLYMFIPTLPQQSVLYSEHKIQFYI